jgi:hypothetical protein
LLLKTTTCAVRNLPRTSTLTFHQNPTYVICEVRQRFNTVYQCNFLDETSEEEFYGEEFHGEELFREELFGEELSSGRIALGKNCFLEELLLERIALEKNCRGRIVWGRIHREELIIYGFFNPFNTD